MPNKLIISVRELNGIHVFFCRLHCWKFVGFSNWQFIDAIRIFQQCFECDIKRWGINEISVKMMLMEFLIEYSPYSIKSFTWINKTIIQIITWIKMEQPGIHFSRKFDPKLKQKIGIQFHFNDWIKLSENAEKRKNQFVDQLFQLYKFPLNWILN
jgi:4-alpha-glucanotransferase